MVDDAVTGGQLLDRGYLKVSIDGSRHLLHCLAWLWMAGSMQRANLAHDGSLPPADLVSQRRSTVLLQLVRRCEARMQRRATALARACSSCVAVSSRASMASLRMPYVLLTGFEAGAAGAPNRNQAF